VVAGRGWISLTYNRLDNSELYRGKDDKAIKSAYQLAIVHGKENRDLSCLNLEDRVIGTMMDKIMEHKIRERALEQACNEQHEDIEAHRLETLIAASK